MSNTSLLGSYGGLGSSGLLFRNKLINGNFDIWQRGTSQTSAGYGSDDRWVNEHGGSTKTHSRQAFTLGQTDVPGNPEFFSRTVVSSVAGNANYVYKAQRIENVKTLAGQTATLSFWAKADAPKPMALEFLQEFGTGGSPSARVAGIGVTTIALTTSWKYYTVTVNIPSIAGKTLGTDNNNYLAMRWWFDAGSDYNARTNSLGQQSGTFDIAQVQLEAGSVATPFEHRPIGLELQLCHRYYQVVKADFGTASGATTLVFNLQLFTPLRANPNKIDRVGGSFRFGDMVSVGASSSSTPTLVTSHLVNNICVSAFVGGFSGLTQYRTYKHEPIAPDNGLFGVDAEL